MPAIRLMRTGATEAVSEPNVGQLTTEARDILLQTLTVKVEQLTKENETLTDAIVRHTESLARNDVIAQGLRHDLQVVSAQIKELTVTLGQVKNMLVSIVTTEHQA